ncbi:SDR family NAD(P)-dependent oxidoreductase [Actinoplanes sp. NPDC023801]|uniref:SDR family NAD(P)-dependent oxidoreductase n=1 Tax=Actinoplanes sp. NPDC023801 TaxID=3154595 RepID=UPI0033ECA004
MTSRWTAEHLPDLTGRTFVVTGAAGGLGRATTTALLARGAHVIAGVRDPGRAPAGAEAHHLDLADRTSVQAFSDALHHRYRHLDVLINNAAVMAPPHTLTPDGHELQFATNHLGHFALTHRLLDLLAAGRDPRVVTVTSVNHRQARTPLDGGGRYSPMGAYNRSKLANAVFGVELHRRLTAAGSPVRSILAHPGYTRTGLQSAATTPMWRFLLDRLGNPLIAQPADRGAWPQLFAAAAPAAEAGVLYGPDGPGELRGHPVPVRLSAAATDPAIGRRLWELSESLTG